MIIIVAVVIVIIIIPVLRAVSRSSPFSALTVCVRGSLDECARGDGSLVPEARFPTLLRDSGLGDRPTLVCTVLRWTFAGLSYSNSFLPKSIADCLWRPS